MIEDIVTVYRKMSPLPPKLRVEGLTKKCSIQTPIEWNLNFKGFDTIRRMT